MSFIHNDDMEILKISSADKSLQWNYKYHTTSTAIGFNLKEPMFIIPDMKSD